ncbi:unnamed protein product [Dibothriocephalus latus]|uniref:Interferon-related developmental regulator C-terminal domain-containing protein n=1 Tax=Dibothriocephalus latus TaxID=60516 RepID=A0A3P7LI50_DIBLA|nr:unnamed protein product [Dibothriocephalus latus]
MGAPATKSTVSQAEKTMNKAARHYANQFAFKVRTQYLLPSRDKRANVVDTDADLSLIGPLSKYHQALIVQLYINMDLVYLRLFTGNRFHKSVVQEMSLSYYSVRSF